MFVGPLLGSQISSAEGKPCFRPRLELDGEVVARTRLDASAEANKVFFCFFCLWCVVFFRAWGLGASKSPAEAHYLEIPLNPNHLFRAQAPQGFMAIKLMPFCLPSNHPASPDNECSQHTLMDSDNILYDPMYGNPIGPIVRYYTCGHAGGPLSKIPFHVRYLIPGWWRGLLLRGNYFPVWNGPAISCSNKPSGWGVGGWGETASIRA